MYMSGNTPSHIKLSCRICSKVEDHFKNGMCDDCFYLYEVIMKTNSSDIKRETLERLLSKMAADYGSWRDSIQDEKKDEL